MRWLYLKSRWLHKWIGLTLVGYCAWMGLSGVLVNHPEWIGRYSVPGWMVPPQYHLHDWNRGALVEMTFSPDDPRTGWLAGSEGVWETEDGGRTFRPLDRGFPTGPRERRTRSLLRVDDGPAAGLWAGTDGGLFRLAPGAEAWRRYPLGDGHGTEEMKTVLRVGKRLLAFTADGAWESRAGEPFRPVEMRRGPASGVSPGDPESTPPPRESLVTFFFEAHSGRILGLPGRLVMDVVGILLFYLSLSAAYLWFVPWRKRRLQARGRRPPPSGPFARRVFRILFDTHLDLGIWASPLFLLLATTGLFMRPPLLAALVDGTVPARLFPGKDHANPWEGRIRRAMHDAAGHRLVVETDEGFFTGPDDLSGPLRPDDLGLPVHVMGTSFLRAGSDGALFAGSFSGAFRRDPNGGRVVDLVTGSEAGAVSRMRPADLMVTGWFRTPGGEEFLTTHREGLVPLGDAVRGDRFVMPTEMARRYRMSLWNWMFELHNSRIFRDVIGAFVTLVPPVGSLLFGFLAITGIIDWAYLKARKSAGGTSEVSRP